MAKVEQVEKLIKMRDWIDDNFPKHYKPYEDSFVEQAKSLGLDPYTLKAVKREMELRFNVNNVEWQLMHILLHFSAMRQAGINNRVVNDKKIDVEIKGAKKENQAIIDRMMLLMWDVLEKESS